MGHCRFRNTLTDLEDCQRAMEEDDWEDEDMSDEEKSARNSLVKVCEEIAREFGDE